VTAPERRRSAGRQSLVLATLITIAWHAVLFASAFGLPPMSPSWFPDLGATVVNLLALLVPLAVIAWQGWWGRRFVRPGVPSRPLLLVPLLLVSLSYGLQGIEGSARILLSSAVLFLALGLSEEMLSRGVVQEVLAPLTPRVRVLWVGLLFGLGHVLSAVAFGRPLDDTVVQVVSATAFGAGFAAVRLHIGVVWPLALLHGLDDWMQVNSPGAAPWVWQLVVAIGYGLAAWALTRPGTPPEPGRARPATMGT
jgi:hypothetical protein